jgi:hypothetical protein
VAQHLAILCFDYEAVLRELLLAPRPDEETDIHAGLQQTGPIETT